MAIEKHEFELFVHSVTELLKREQLIEEERYRRGEKYNIFQIMSMESDEVSTHSAVVANLLDPRGSHGCGDAFLKLFLSQISDLNDFDFPTENAIVKVEYVIGPITDDEGGRIDILILSKDKKKGIIIENKIYASDQPRQLYRYYKFAQNLQEHRILYLTLDGKDPSNDSITNKAGNDKLKGQGNSDDGKADFYCISYASDILRWLESCVEKTTQKPLLRETLAQYIDLLKKLTHQNMANSTKKELAEVCTRPENIESLLWVHRNFESIIAEIMNNTFVPQLEELAQKKGFEPVFVKDNDWLNTKYMRFAFKKPEWKTFEICFEFQGRNMSKMGSGYRYQDGHRDTERENYNKLASVADGKRTQGWPIFRLWPSSEQNWLSGNEFEKISNRKLIQKIEEEIDFYLAGISSCGATM